MTSLHTGHTHTHTHRISLLHTQDTHTHARIHTESLSYTHRTHTRTHAYTQTLSLSHTQHTYFTVDGVGMFLQLLKLQHGRWRKSCNSAQGGTRFIYPSSLHTLQHFT